MKWYLAKIVFQININGGESANQFDESLRLIEATSVTDALQKARTMGKRDETSFRNAMNEVVLWRFIDVSMILPIDKLQHGVELFSTTHIDENPPAHIQNLHRTAMVIQNEETILS